jgi:hypothetical protein
VSDHARFEALAGAVMLGEATDAERERFAEHAACCAACRDDAEAMPAFRRTVERARDAETWRPSVDDAVGRRIRASQRSRFGVTIGALGWAVALSIVLNVAFVSGLSGHIHDAFENGEEAASNVPAMRIELEQKAPVRVTVAPVVRVAAAAPRMRRRPHLLAAAPARAARADTATADVPGAYESDPRASLEAEAATVPDVLAGLGLDDASPDAAKHVAVRPRCETPSRADGGTSDTPPEPCAAATELHH